MLPTAILSIAALVSIAALTLPTAGCSRDSYTKGPVNDAVLRTLAQGGPVVDDLEARGLVTRPSSGTSGTPATFQIKVGEIERLVGSGIYAIDGEGYLVFGPSHAAPAGTVPASTILTSAMIGKVLGIPVELGPESSLHEGIALEFGPVKVGTLAKDVWDWQNDVRYNQGDWCILVVADLTNATDKRYWLDVSARGYDIRSNEVSFTIYQGGIPFFGRMDVGSEAHSERTFEIPLKWSEELSLIEVSARSYEGYFKQPLPKVTLPDFETALAAIRQETTLAVAANYATRELKSFTSRMPEFLAYVDKSSVKRVLSKAELAGRDRIPFPQEYGLSFELKDGPKVQLEYSGGSIWFEANDAFYEASVDPAIKEFLRGLLP